MFKYWLVSLSTLPVMKGHQQVHQLLVLQNRCHAWYDHVSQPAVQLTGHVNQLYVTVLLLSLPLEDVSDVSVRLTVEIV